MITISTITRQADGKHVMLAVHGEARELAAHVRRAATDASNTGHKRCQTEAKRHVANVSHLGTTETCDCVY